MHYVRGALFLALTLIAAGCATPQQGTQGSLPQTITYRTTTGNQATISGGNAAVALALVETLRRNYAAAVRLSTTAINSGQLAGNDLAQAHAVRGDAYFFGGDAAKARDDWRKAVEMNAANTIGLRGMALISHMQRKENDAIQYMDRAIATAPNLAALYVLRGQIRLDDRRAVALAIADFEKAIAIKPDLAVAYFYRGLAHHLNGRFSQAKVDYEKALEINPAESRARAALGLLERRRAPDENLRPRRGPSDVVQF